MDLPLEALKMVAQAVPVDGGGSHNLRWTPENGFVLGIQWAGQWYDIRFDFDDKLEDIKEEIQILTGIPMPEQKKTKKEQPMGKEGHMKTPLLDTIKKAVLGGDNLGSISGRYGAQQEALNAAIGPKPAAPPPITPTRVSRTSPGSILNTMQNMQRRVTGV